jgi:STE24 endopeptidase
MIPGKNHKVSARLLAILVLLLIACFSVSANEVSPTDGFSNEEVERSRQYNDNLYAIFFLKQLVVIGFLGFVAWSRLGSSYKQDVEKLCRGKRRLVFPAYAFFLVLIARLVAMPFDAVRDLVVKKSFGLTTQGPPSWLADQARSFLFWDIWYVPLIVVVYAAMKRFKRTWWLLSSGVLALGMIAWHSLSPHVIEPLSLRITPVKSEALRSHLDPLLERSGIDRGALFEADSGKKTKEVNAYMSGLLLGKRIVLYNVLAEEADPGQIEFVVAHEIGHWKRNHVMKGIAWATAGAAGGLLLIRALVKLTAGKKRGEARGSHRVESLPVFFFWMHVVLFAVLPLECAISRHFERTTDRYALALTQRPEAAIGLFRHVARTNLLDLNPPPVARFWLYTHPPVLERIRAMSEMTGTLGERKGAEDGEED